MKKIYFNLFHNNAIVVDETTKTYSLIKATEIKNQSGFSYLSKMTRLLEIKKSLFKRGFQRA